MRRWYGAFAVFLVGLLCSPTLSAFQPGQTEQKPVPAKAIGKRWALVVGISSYEALPILTHANSDAASFAQTLRQVDPGLDEKNLRVLLDHKATLYEIRKVFEELRRLEEPLDVLYFYFTGYAVGDVGDQADAFLLPSDARLKDVSSTSLSLRELRSKLEDNPAKNIIVIVDAAFHSEIGKALKVPTAKEDQTIQHLMGLTKDLRWVSVFSRMREASETNQESEQESFSRHLVDGLRGKADSNRDETVQTSELSHYLRQRSTQQGWNQSSFALQAVRSDLVLASTKPRESEPPTQPAKPVDPPPTPPSPPPPPSQPTKRADPPPAPLPSPPPDPCSGASSLKEAVQRDPQNVPKRYELAEAYMKLECYKEAASEFEFLISNLGQKDDPPAHNKLAICYTELGQLDKAVEEYHRVIQLKPNDPGGYYNLGLAYYTMERYAEAIEQLNDALNLEMKLGKNYGETYYAKGLAYYRLGKKEEQKRRECYQEARISYQQAAKENPGWSRPRTALGQLYEEMGRCAEAIPEYKKAIETDDKDASAYYGLGVCSERLGKAKDSISAYERALELDPEGKTAGFDPSDLRKRLQRLKDQTTQ